MCDHQFEYIGVRYRDGKWPLPGTGATQRYYAHVYFCNKCLETKGKQIDDNGQRWHSYQNVEFAATPGSADECCVPVRDRHS